MPEIEDKVYDVAISFLGVDETYAKELHDALRERLEVFYYAERQDELVSEDGEEAFGSVFRDKARIVVVFYREGWGETMMTRAERSGIKQRAASEGYSFSIWVPVGETRSVPAFIDPQFIWYDIDRWGIEGLAAIVEKHVQESGRYVRPETTADRLLKVKRRIDLEKQRRAYERSPDGVKFVTGCLSRLANVIETHLERYAEVSKEISFQLKREHFWLIVISFYYRCVFHLEPYAQNTITGAYLAAHLQEDVSERSWEEDWRDVSKLMFKPTLDDNGDPAWLLEGQGFFTFETAVAQALDNMAEPVYLAYEKYIAKNR